ncbi:MAG: 2-isopropylmalate synthase [Pyrinomonadaceae bacterium]|nr:2-isopropylmalate synthase [Pyrinomonadaceae bacterium]
MELKESDLAEVIFSDTTLRDGEQMPGASLRPAEKVLIAKALADIGIKSIDAGFPICAKSETEAIRRIVREVEGPVISALSRTLRSDIDAAYAALSEAPPNRRAVSLFVSTSPLHREFKLNKTKAELIKIITDSIEYARRFFHLVAFAPEDASNTELAFLCEVYTEAIAAGATTIGFPDTLGILTPERVREFIRHLQDNVRDINRTPLACHFHNDLGLATANTLAAVAEGVRIVQCTVNGIGERAGNTSFEEVVMALHLNREQYRRRHSIDTTKLTALSRLVEKLTGVPVSPNKAVVGSNVFATEAGIHQDGMMKHPETYVPFPPGMVGAEKIQFVLGKHSGRAAISARLKELGFELTGNQLELVIEQVREAGKSDWANDKVLLAQAVERVSSGS